MHSECDAKVLADTLNTQGISSPAILYMLGIMSKRPWEAVNVVVSAPAWSEPCTAPAAPASDCISCTLTFCPQKFVLPLAAHLSTCSAIGEDGVIGYMAATSENI